MTAIAPLAPVNAASGMATAGTAPAPSDPLRKQFQATVAGLFFGELMKAMRSTVGEPAYLHGGQAEELFQQQLDQILVDEMAEKNGAAIIGPMYEQFRRQLPLPVGAAAGPSADSSPGAAATASGTGGGVGEPRTREGDARSDLRSVSPLRSLQSTPPEQLAELADVARQAQSGELRQQAATATAGLSALFRK